MKTKDLIKLLESNGWKLKRHGGIHDVYEKVRSGRSFRDIMR